MKKSITMLILIAVAVAGCVSYPSICHTPSIKGRIVYSIPMTFLNQTQVNKGDPVTNVPIYIFMSAIQRTETIGDGGPQWETKKTWRYYTFADQQGYFNIPALWGSYTSTRGLFTDTMKIEPMFAILETTANVTVETEHGSIFPFTIIHPSDPLQKSLAELREKNAKPIHVQDEVQLQALLDQMKIVVTNCVTGSD